MTAHYVRRMKTGIPEAEKRADRRADRLIGADLRELDRDIDDCIRIDIRRVGEQLKVLSAELARLRALTRKKR